MRRNPAAQALACSYGSVRQVVTLPLPLPATLVPGDAAAAARVRPAVCPARLADSRRAILALTHY